MCATYATFPEENDLLKACYTLYGGSAAIDHGFLEQLQSKELKSAYRQRAKDTHPDRRCAVERSLVDSSASFIEISHAYEKLTAFLKERSKSKKTFGQAKTASSTRKAEKKTTGSPPFVYPRAARRTHSTFSPKARPDFQKPYICSLPGWELRLGEYLFYAGLISWGELIEAIVWQKKCRPLLGEIALRWRWISAEQLHRSLFLRRRGEKLGEILLRFGIIDGFQKTKLLQYQKQCQPLIGNYFIGAGKMAEVQIQEHLRILSRHNLQISSNKARKSGLRFS